MYLVFTTDRPSRFLLTLVLCKMRERPNRNLYGVYSLSSSTNSRAFQGWFWTQSLCSLFQFLKDKLNIIRRCSFGTNLSKNEVKQKQRGWARKMEKLFWFLFLPFKNYLKILNGAHARNQTSALNWKEKYLLSILQSMLVLADFVVNDEQKMSFAAWKVIRELLVSFQN